MIELILLIPTIVLGVQLYRADRRFDEAQKAWRLERVGLLQRIQAPERAVIEDFAPSSTAQSVGFDNDEEFWAAKEELNGRS